MFHNSGNEADLIEAEAKLESKRRMRFHSLQLREFFGVEVAPFPGCYDTNPIKKAAWEE